MDINYDQAKKISVTVNSCQKTVQSIYKTVNGVFVKVYNSVVTILLPSTEIYRHTGSVISPEWVNYNSEQMVIGGTVSAYDIGFYIATFTPNEGFQWEDGTTETKSVVWEIRENWSTVLQDFEYTENDDGTATITAWKETLNGVASTEMIVPDNHRIVL